jgi:hypothetical protein
LYLRIPENGAWTPKRVGVSKPYVQFVTLLSAFFGECDRFK